MRITDADMQTLWGRFRAHVDLMWVDHGFLRIFWTNRWRVTPDLWRSNQPGPNWIRYLGWRGIKTIVNLRGENDSGWYHSEKRACERAGIELVNFRVKSRDMPTREVVNGALELFDGLTYPALMHCKSGADRAGFMAALYLLAREGRPVEQAMKQLHWKYGHVKASKTGLLDSFFEAYRDANAERPIDFLEWVNTVYDADRLKRAFKSGKFADILVDDILHRE
jgi:protein tyrosine/serine phosphatase